MNTKNEYRNDSPGVCGVTTIENGKTKGIAVKPGDSIWLSEEERIATANAPKRDGDNPFTNGTLTLVTPAAEIKNRRDIGPDELEGEKPEPQSEVQPSPEEVQQEAKAQQTEADREAKAEAARRAQAAKQAENPGKPLDETGAAVQPKGLPHQGRSAPQEEVATPEAPAKAGAKG